MYVLLTKIEDVDLPECKRQRRLPRCSSWESCKALGSPSRRQWQWTWDEKENKLKSSALTLIADLVGNHNHNSSKQESIESKETAVGPSSTHFVRQNGAWNFWAPQYCLFYYPTHSQGPQPVPGGRGSRRCCRPCCWRWWPSGSRRRRRRWSQWWSALFARKGLAFQTNCGDQNIYHNNNNNKMVIMHTGLNFQTDKWI